MTGWEDYPENYRAREVAEIRDAICAGECVSVIGLSGSGKSNLMGFLARRIGLPQGCPQCMLVDCKPAISKCIAFLLQLGAPIPRGRRGG